MINKIIELIIELIIDNGLWLYTLCFIITFVLVRLDFFSYGLIFSIKYKRTWMSLFERVMFSVIICIPFILAMVITLPFFFLTIGVVELLKLITKECRLDLSKPPKFL